ncbi:MULTISPECIES: hypothetical protein [Thermomonospora]|uniref:Uncharacterized protein n=1 Tax=Thermomonospora cellulosilytica TaxID=1411118 RepID=A0A7W3R666_9ACTN|nr:MULTISPECIES: hypothetical protein [Thermomonospora]MBA9001186.1 hypothetical protein [Thermomonospora cellulosilytica]
MEIVLSWIVQSSFAMTEVRHIVGLVAAVALALVTAFASWHITDRVVTALQRPDEE